MERTYQEAVEEIKNRLDIVDVVSRYVVLKKSGSSYMGCCPFHKEKTPSFSVNKAKGIFKCFGCGEGGDAISFLMKIQGKSFRDVIEEEARSMGIELPVSRGSGDFGQKKKLALEAMNAAAEFFTKNLFDSPDAEFAREYLKNRSVTEDIIKKYGLGYSPKSFDGLQKATGIDIDILQSAGLIIKREKEKGYIDRFRNRLMIPVRDENGHIVAFGARALAEGQNPKYLNSPDTFLYNKSRILYGFDTAKQAIKDLDSVLICEGYFDVISLQSGGVTNAVASCGTALTNEHITLIAKYCESRKIYLAFDTDSAGQMATERSAELIKEAFGGLGNIRQFDESYAPVSDKYSCEIRVVSPPDGKDPDEFIREHGAEAYFEHLKKAPLLLDYRLNKVIPDNVKTLPPVEKMKTVRKILPLIEEINNKLVQNEYVKLIAKKLEIDEKIFLAEIDRFKSEQENLSESDFKIKSQIVTKSSNFILKLEKNLFSLFFTNMSDDNRLALIQIINEQNFTEEDFKILLEAIDKTANRIHNTEELIQVLFTEFQENNKIKDIITDLIFLSKPYENLSEKDLQTVMFDTVKKLELFRRKEELRMLKNESKSSSNGEIDKVQYQLKVNEKLKKNK